MNTAADRKAPAQNREPWQERWQDLPKVSLHEHIDGSLRAQTLLELARARGMHLPQQDAHTLAQWMLDNAHCGSLPRYLAGFELTIAAMTSIAACERVAFELAEDAQAEGCVLAEFRVAPQLFESHGLSAAAATEALLRGLQKSSLPCGLIICGMRQHSPAATASAARLAAQYRTQGVVGFDLAGPEDGYPAQQHREAIAIALQAGLGLTLHAGEAASGAQVIEAAQLGAQRIGHGVKVVDQADWLRAAQDYGLHFEVCPSSNLHTGAVSSYATHPIKTMLAAGLSLSCSTDNRLMSATTLNAELKALYQHTGLSLAQLVQLQADGVRASFLPRAQRQAAWQKLQAWCQGMDVALEPWPLL